MMLRGGVHSGVHRFGKTRGAAITWHVRFVRMSGHRETKLPGPLRANRKSALASCFLSVPVSQQLFWFDEMFADRMGSRSIRIAHAVRGLHAKCSYRASLGFGGSVVLARSRGYWLWKQVCNRPSPFIQSKSP